MTTIEFSDVGRNKKSWTKTWAREIDEDDIADEARANGGLMSSCVEACWKEDETNGVIFVGMFRAVGSFKLITNSVVTA